MKLIKETKHLDLVINSKPWKKEELEDFRTLMNLIKGKSNLPDLSEGCFA